MLRSRKPVPDTITEFDFGVERSMRLSERVAETPAVVTKLDVNFILWLLLDQECQKVKTANQSNGDFGPTTPKTNASRTQHDGSDSDEDDGLDGESDRPDATHNSMPPALFSRLEPATETLVRDYAKRSLREAGVENYDLLEHLPENYRKDMLMQLYMGSGLVPGNSFRSVPDIYAALRSSNFENKFNILRSLGEGHFGEVYHVQRKDNPNEQFAMKKIPVTFESLLDDVQMAINESNILKTLRGHKNIVKLYNCWLELDPSKDTHYRMFSSDDEPYLGGFNFYIQLELCGLSLQTWKNENYRNRIFPEPPETLKIAYEVFDGLAYIHAHNIYHLDINPNNIVWDNSECTHLKIVDFGLAVFEPTSNDGRGTACYAASENILTSMSDLYSASVSIIEVTRTIHTQIELVEVIRSANPGLGIPTLDKLLSLCLNKDPSKRPTAESIKLELEVLIREQHTDY